jgi:hypothetical protein
MVSVPRPADRDERNDPLGAAWKFEAPTLLINILAARGVRRAEDDHELRCFEGGKNRL